MSTVKIPPVLRASVGGAKEVEASGASVGDVLRSLAEQHPATASQLFSEEGELNRYVNVYLNDETCGCSTGSIRACQRAHDRDPAWPWPAAALIVRHARGRRRALGRLWDAPPAPRSHRC